LALIETGTFYEADIAETFKAVADEFEVSIGFAYPPDEPDAAGVLHHIRIFERSLVPRGRASNLLTSFAVKEAPMEPEDKSILDKLIGKENVDRILGRSKKAQEAAVAAGIAHKQADDDEKKPDDEAAPPPAPEGQAPPPPEDEKPAEEQPAAEAAPPAEDAPRTLGNMTEDELKGYVAKCMEPFAAQMEELKSMLGARKEAGDAAAVQTATALKATADGLAELRQGFAALGVAVAELTGEMPRAQRRGYRADQDPATIASKERATALGAPEADPFNEFTKFAVGGQPQR
jgi:hypothetical protein